MVRLASLLTQSLFFSCAHVKFIAGNLGEMVEECLYWLVLSSYDIPSLFND